MKSAARSTPAARRTPRTAQRASAASTRATTQAPASEPRKSARKPVADDSTPAATRPALGQTTTAAPTPAKSRQAPRTAASEAGVVGGGGETHQQAGKGGETLTSNHGVPIADNQNSLRAGERGPTLLEDFLLREKIFHFDHERIPERIVHARGSAAHGVFECTRPIPELTRAALFQKKGKQTSVFCRFSTVAGGAGSVDTPRDVRGFAVKFYTEEGNWDLVGNNIPVFFIQDAIKFPDLVHSVKMEADRGYPQAASAHDTFWDFISLMPESMHMVMWAMSDRTIPRSLRMMEGFGVHTFRMINEAGESTFVKFHWKPVLGVQSTTWDEACKIAGADPDYHRRDLFEAIDAGQFPSWELGIQRFDEAFAESLPYDVLDPTKLIPEELCPVTIIGRMTLNRNVDNFFAETEQVAFLPTNVPPGIDFSNDPLLQGRLFSYLDTQKSRLGTTNFHQIPINAPKCPFANFQRDGLMQTRVPTGRANYEPNSLADAGELGGPREHPGRGFDSFSANAERNGPEHKLRVRAESFADHYSQAQLFYRSQTAVEQDHIAAALIFELSKVTLAHVRERVLSRVRHIDEALAKRVCEGIGMALPGKAPVAREAVDLGVSDALSILKNAKPLLVGRAVGIVFDVGSVLAEVMAVKDAAARDGAKVKLIAPKLLGNALKGGVLDADAQLAGCPSATLDAVALVLSEEAGQRLAHMKAAVDFVSDAFAHLKAIGHSAGAAPLLKKAGVQPDEGVTGLDAEFLAAARQRFHARERAVGTKP